MLTITNAVKAQFIVLVNAVLGVLAAFGVAGITDAQKGALLVAVNAVLGLLVAVTYKSSSKRVPDSTATPVPPAAVPVVVAPSPAAVTSDAATP